MTKRPFVVGITGGSGSGKTTFIRELSNHFSNDEICLISQDNYYRVREEQKTDEQGIKNFDRPKSIDKKEYTKDVLSILKGHTVERMEYTFNNEKKDPQMLTFFPAPIIILEGLFIYHFKRIAKEIDLKLFLTAKEHLKLSRRIKRDQMERNYPLEDVLYRYEKHVTPSFEKYIKPHMSDVDVIVNNNEHYGTALEMVAAFLKTKI